MIYYIYIALFGALGATARYWLSINLESSAFPFNTLLINILGCFLLAIVTKYLANLPNFSSSLIMGLGTGLIASFTTFSTFSVETAQLILNGSYLISGVYIISSLMGGFFSASLGVYVSTKLNKRRELGNN